MNKNKLLYGRALFTLIIIICFGLIIMHEKGAELFSKQIEKKINTYIETNYNDLNNINKSNLSFNSNTFTMKISSKDNDNHFFTIKYQNKKITDTYQKDYIEGNNFFIYINDKLEKEIKSKTKEKVKVENISTLDKYNNQVQERLLKEDNLLSLKYYRVIKEYTINFNEQEISNEITSFINNLYSNNITPKYYTFIITNKNDITSSIKVTNITEEYINDENKVKIIKDILENNK